MSDRLVTFTLYAPLEFFAVLTVEFDFGSSFCFATDELSMILGVLTPDEGFEAAVCWISLPCSAMSVGASF